MAVKDMTGQKIGLIEVIERDGSDRFGCARWKCRCQCGNEFIAVGGAIRNGHVRSCGHLQRDTASRLKGTHRMSKTPLYKAWEGMKQRCENPNSTAYKDYGAKGIFVCKEWHNFEVFYSWAIENGYRQGLTIERKDNARGYCPDNCCFTTRQEQNKNTTRTHRIIGDGLIFTAAEAARYVGVSRSTVARWVREGKVKTISDVVALTKRRKD